MSREITATNQLAERTAAAAAVVATRRRKRKVAGHGSCSRSSSSSVLLSAPTSATPSTAPRRGLRGSKKMPRLTYIYLRYQNEHQSVRSGDELFLAVERLSCIACESFDYLRCVWCLTSRLLPLGSFFSSIEMKPVMIILVIRKSYCFQGCITSKVVGVSYTLSIKRCNMQHARRWQVSRTVSNGYDTPSSEFIYYQMIVGILGRPIQLFPARSRSSFHIRSTI